ncbi:hypothetical protein Tco_1527476, partial [Tanacetum coccineum]
MISTVFLLYSYEYVFNHIFEELRGNAAEIFSNSKSMSADVARGHSGDGGGDDRP